MRVGNGTFHFNAPRGWKTTVALTSVTAIHGRESVQVSTFPLARAYTPALFTKVESELAARMSTVADQIGGTVTGHRVVTAGGVRSHEYDLKAAGRTDRYTFVLRGKREFLLLCSADAAVCDELAASFSAG